MYFIRCILSDECEEFDENKINTRLYTADAVWNRHPSGQPTNTVKPNLN